MDFTGERYVPSLKGQIYYEHLHRYAIAAEACAGKRVLDLACGEGYGSAFLAQHAADVIGVDIDEPTVAFATATYSRSNLRFLAGAANAIPLPGGSVDVVVSFETIEHLEDHEGMLAEFVRVLAPGGLLIISSPNKLIYSDKTHYENPFHVRELYFEEFRDLLGAHFPNVELYGQRLVASSVLHPLEGARSRTARWISGNVEGVEVGLPTLDDPQYFIAVCSSDPLPPNIASGFVDPHDDLFQHFIEGVREHAAAYIRERVGPPKPMPNVGTREGAPIRVMLACAPKSGSTYAANVLARYLDIPFGNMVLREMQWEAEQNLNRSLLNQFGDGSYLLQFHLKPYPLNFALMREYGIDLLLQWRNLGDAIVSLDEHLAEFGTQQPLCYIHDGDGFLARPAQYRYQYLIRQALPWYIGFYLGWRLQQRAFGVYETMANDPHAFFEEAIARLGRPLDAARLDEILATPTGFLRINVGKIGRSAGLFEPETKRLLENVVLDNPWSGQLDILLWELPWNAPPLHPQTECDGSIVKCARNPQQYFVSRGVRRRLPDDGGTWVASRSHLRYQPVTVVSKKLLDAIPEAAALS